MSLRALGRFDGHWVTGYPTILKRTWCRVGTTPRPFGFKKTGGNFPLLGNMRGKFMTFPSNKLLLCSVLQLQGLLWRYVLERAQLLRSTAKWNRVGKLRQHFNCISEDHRKKYRTSEKQRRLMTICHPGFWNPKYSNLLWPSLLAHPKLQKVDQSGPGCLRSSSKHMIRNNCRTALGKLPTSYVLCRCLSIF